MKASNKILFNVLIFFIFSVGSRASGESFIFTRNLTIGIRGSDVSALQQSLIDGGFLKIPAPTGYFGDITKEGLRRFQEKNSIVPSVGYFGPITRAIMNQEVAPPIYSAPSASVTPVSPNVADLQKQIEALLTELQKLQSVASITEIKNDAVIKTADGLPVRLIIPKMNVNAGFQYNGLTADGALEIPSNVTDIGWYTGSPRPGEIGSSVVTGHTAQIRGGILTRQGVFNNLRVLSPGDKLYVINDKGETITFIVRESRTFDPNASASEVFGSSDGKAHLNLITCEGFWNSEELSYSERLVVFTDIAQ